MINTLGNNKSQKKIFKIIKNLKITSKMIIHDT